MILFGGGTICCFFVSLFVSFLCLFVSFVFPWFWRIPWFAWFLIEALVGISRGFPWTKAAGPALRVLRLESPRLRRLGAGPAAGGAAAVRGAGLRARLAGGAKGKLRAGG